MKLVLLSVGGELPSWLHQMVQDTEKKISHLFPFEFVFLKSPKIPRGQKELKKKKETELLLGKLQPQDLVYLADERGRSLDTLKFTQRLERDLASGKQRLVVVVGGAYGVDQEMMERADLKLSLSPMVLNHHVAITVVLEQLYRALTIKEGLPYHNA